VIGQYWLFWSLAPAFLPIDASFGTLLLAAPIHLLATGLTSGANAAVDFQVPNNPSVIGLNVWLQGARRDVGPVGPIELTNSVCLTVQGPSPPCTQPGC
jgi:hypothetical protein